MFCVMVLRVSCVFEAILCTIALGPRDSLNYSADSNRLDREVLFPSSYIGPDFNF